VVQVVWLLAKMARLSPNVENSSSIGWFFSGVHGGGVVKTSD
jgi:hypothetical protein